MDWYGTGSVYVELNQNRLRGDTDRNRRLARIAGEAGVPVVATNDVLYHHPEPLPPPGCAGRRAAQHDHRPGPATPSPQQPLLSEVPCPDGTALQGVAGGRLQHPAGGGAVRLQSQHRPGLYPAQSLSAGGLHGRELPAEALLRGQPRGDMARCPRESMSVSGRSSG